MQALRGIQGFLSQRGLMALATVALGASSIGVGASSLAMWTDTDTVGANTFTAGTVVLTTSPTTALVTFTSMVPGDVVTGLITVTNSGTAQLRYAMSTTATNADAKALKDQLTLVIKTRDVASAVCTAFDGTQLYTGALSGGALGSNAAGAQAGDRTVASAANDVLCFRVTLPSATANTFQGAATTATFTFDSEQTSNNP